MLDFATQGGSGFVGSVPMICSIHESWRSTEIGFPGTQIAASFSLTSRRLNNTTGQVTAPDLWRPIPEKQWQVLEMMRCTYVHGNSICVRREAWEEAGPFDENLRHGQDYDMWLRLLALTTGTYIPERTCVTRVHEAQGTHSFPQMGFFDSSRSVINFLNAHTFPDLVPSLDLQDRSAVKQALLQALDVASDSSSWFIYKLGPHPALLLRIMEWAWHGCEKPFANLAKRIVRRSIEQIAIRHRGTPFGFLWKVAAAACRLPESTFHYLSVRPDTVAETNYWLLNVDSHQNAEPLRTVFGEILESSISPREQLVQGKAQGRSSSYVRMDRRLAILSSTAHFVPPWSLRSI